MRIYKYPKFIEAHWITLDHIELLGPHVCVCHAKFTGLANFKHVNIQK